MDFSDPDVSTLQTKLDDAENQISVAQLEMKRLKEKQRLEIARLRKDRDNVKAELQRANKDVADLTRRVADEKTKSIATLVSEAVGAILRQHVNPWVLAFCPAWLARPPSLNAIFWGPSVSSTET
ncbi:hypothetical protein FRC00_002756, partial [Tulasnella sp. 408]